METFLSSPSMVLLCTAAVFTFGLLFGWLLRANVREKELNAEISMLRLDLQNSNQQNEATKEEYNLKVADTQKAVLEAAQLRLQIEEIQAEKETLSREVAQINSESYTSEQTDVQTDTDSLEQEIATQKTRISILAKENEIFQEQLAELRDTSLTENKGESDNLLLEETIVQLEKERNQAIDEADEMASQIATMRLELTKADSDMALAKVQLTRLETALHASKSEIERLEAEELAAVPSAAIGEGTPTLQRSKEAVILDNMLHENHEIADSATEDFDAADAFLSAFGGLKPVPKVENQTKSNNSEAESPVSTEKTPLEEIQLATKSERAEVSDETDLKIINGIGEKFEKKLNALGISTFQQLAELDANKELLSKVSKKLRVSMKRIRQEEWAAQARHLLEMEQIN